MRLEALTSLAILVASGCLAGESVTDLDSSTAEPRADAGAQIATDAGSRADAGPISADASAPPERAADGGFLWWAGVTYNDNAIDARSGSILQTDMVVEPDGLGDFSGWIYLTATNRTAKGVEFLAGYSGSEAALWVFDWSCSATSPCSNDVKQPDYVQSDPLSKEPCYLATKSDSAGTRRTVLSYRNETALLSATTPQSWTNRVWIYNNCTSQWDLYYEHPYTGSQKDCRVAQNNCGWWGPILEPYVDGATPTIKPVGFLNTTLTASGATVALDAQNTTFTQPEAPWKTLLLVPDTEWIIGSE